MAKKKGSLDKLKRQAPKSLPKLKSRIKPKLVVPPGATPSFVPKKKRAKPKPRKVDRRRGAPERDTFIV